MAIFHFALLQSRIWGRTSAPELARACILREPARHGTPVRAELRRILALSSGSRGGEICGSRTLSDDKINLHSRLFFVLEAHLTVVLVVVSVLEERDPLCKGADSSVENDVLGDGDGADLLFVLSEGLGQNDDFFRADGGAERDLNWVAEQAVGVEHEHVDELLAQVDVEAEVAPFGASQFLFVDLAVFESDCDKIFCGKQELV
jgi:hypothetical protein